METNIYSFSVNKIDGGNIKLSEFKGKVLLIVNVASQCGLTPQYEALEKVYETYQGKDFKVLGFPANEFEGQEPGTNQEIQEFCQIKFGVKFPMFQKIVVKGQGQHPLYQFLTHQNLESLKPAGPNFEQTLEGYGIKRENRNDILWNFEKFLVNREGKVVARFNPDMTPDDPVVKKAIEAEL